MAGFVEVDNLAVLPADVDDGADGGIQRVRAARMAGDFGLGPRGEGDVVSPVARRDDGGKGVRLDVQRPADGFKRRLRAACVPLLPQMKPGLYVFIARQPAAEAAFDKLSRSMQYLLRRQNLLLPDAQKKLRPAEKAADCP